GPNYVRMPLQGNEFTPCRDVPDRCSFGGISVCRDNEPTVAGNRNAGNYVAASGAPGWWIPKLLYLPTGLRIPHPDNPGAAAGDEAPTIFRNGYRLDTTDLGTMVLMLLKRAQFPSRPRVPYPHYPIGASSHHPHAIGGDTNGADAVCIGIKGHEVTMV